MSCVTVVQGNPVWQQLLLRCAAEPACQAAALRSLAEQLARPTAGAVHKAVTVDLQRQLVAQQQHCDRRFARQEKRLLQQQAQLAEQQEVLQHQAVQIAGPQAQLQELLQRLPAP